MPTTEPIADFGNMVIVEKFRGRHWYWDTAKFVQDLLLQYAAEGKQITGLIVDSAVTNLAAIQLSRKMGSICNGVLPKMVYFKETGWIDVILFFLPINVAKTPKSHSKVDSRPKV